MMLRHPKIYKIGKMTTSDMEIKDLVVAWLAISVAFAIVLNPSGFVLT